MQKAGYLRVDNDTLTTPPPRFMALEGESLEEYEERCASSSSGEANLNAFMSQVANDLNVIMSVNTFSSPC